MYCGLFAYEGENFKNSVIGETRECLENKVENLRRKPNDKISCSK